MSTSGPRKLGHRTKNMKSNASTTDDKINSTRWDKAQLVALHVIARKDSEDSFWPLTEEQKKKLLSPDLEAFIEGKGYSPIPSSESHFTMERCKDDPMLGRIWFSMNYARHHRTTWESTSDTSLADKYYADCVLSYLLRKEPANEVRSGVELDSAADLVIEYSPHRITHNSHRVGKCKIRAMDDGGLDVRLCGKDKGSKRDRVAILHAGLCFDTFNDDGKPEMTNEAFGQVTRIAAAHALDKHIAGSDIEKQGILMVLSVLGYLRFLLFEIPKPVIHGLVRGDLQDLPFVDGTYSHVRHTDWLDLRQKEDRTKTALIVGQIVSQRLDERQSPPQV
ncbi:hypothetical protein F4680DRAFT_453197 [Xylaria scruposa]|nr:hypothetical protein F4680DRAFT_453197 [Xylaria scruposa]